MLNLDALLPRSIQSKPLFIQTSWHSVSASENVSLHDPPTVCRFPLFLSFLNPASSFFMADERDVYMTSDCPSNINLFSFVSFIYVFRIRYRCDSILPMSIIFEFDFWSKVKRILKRSCAVQSTLNIYSSSKCFFLTPGTSFQKLQMDHPFQISADPLQFCILNGNWDFNDKISRFMYIW